MELAHSDIFGFVTSRLNNGRWNLDDIKQDFQLKWNQGSWVSYWNRTPKGLPTLKRHHYGGTAKLLLDRPSLQEWSLSENIKVTIHNITSLANSHLSEYVVQMMYRYKNHPR